VVKKIMIACPVRNRAWILPRYLKSISDLEYPSEYLCYCFVINDCIDSTPNLLADFARERPGQVKIIVQNLGRRQSKSHLRGYYHFAHLAQLRNILLLAFQKSDCDYLFSVDSDILLPPLALNTLLEDDCAIISALVCNGHELGDPSIHNILKHDGQGGWIAIRDFPRNRVFEVDCTGAAYLLKREVIDKYGVRYSATYGAEDIGFCQDAASKGLKIFCDGRVECEHHMRENH
jgi:glycosyltransferase involved in cell wall biosynthesis